MSTVPFPTSQEGEFALDLAQLFPPQGHWPESDYLALTDSTNRLVEFVNGRLEFPTMPTKSHQKMSRFLCNCFIAFMEPGQLGDAVTAPYRIRLPGGVFREPDVVVYLQEHLNRFGERYGDAPDLVVEIVSEGTENRERDLEVKPVEYANAGIAEYWIVDPLRRALQVLVLEGGSYQQHERVGIGEDATSRLLAGFRVAVKDVFSAGGLETA